eukprot:scaffold155901_cov42-Attheya_sp.AAC.1
MADPSPQPQHPPEQKNHHSSTTTNNTSMSEARERNSQHSQPQPLAFDTNIASSCDPLHVYAMAPFLKPGDPTPPQQQQQVVLATTTTPEHTQTIDVHQQQQQQQQQLAYMNFMFQQQQQQMQIQLQIQQQQQQQQQETTTATLAPAMVPQHYYAPGAFPLPTTAIPVTYAAPPPSSVVQPHPTQAHPQAPHQAQELA